MKSSSRRLALVGAFGLAAIVTLGGCSGGSSSLVPNNAQSNASSTTLNQMGTSRRALIRDQQSATGQALIAITIPSKPAQNVRHRAYVSPGTESMTIRVARNHGDRAETYRLNLTASTPGCATNKKTGARVCKKTLALPSGPQSLSIALYAQPNGKGYALAAEQVTVDIATTGTTKIPLALGGVIDTIAVLIDGRSAAKVPVGTPTSLPVQVNAYDVSGNLIIPPGNYTTPIVITNSDQTGITSFAPPPASSARRTRANRIRPFDATTIVKPGTDLTLYYTGDPLNTITLTPATGGFTLEKGVATLSTSGKAIRQYKLPTGTDATVITKGPDGALWFTLSGANEIGRMTTTGSMTEYSVPTTNGFPEAIAAGPDNALWFTELCAGKIGRVTTNGTFTEYPVPLFGSAQYSGPLGIAAGSDGALWFTDQCGDDIGRITTTGTITEIGIPTSYSYPELITAGPDGALWFPEGAGNIGRATTAGITEYSGAGYSFGITVGPDRALWFTETLASQIGRITTAGTITNQYPTPTQTELIGITAGSDGGIWFAEYSNGSIGRTTTGGVMTEYPIPSLGGVPAAPRSLVEGPDNAIWFASDNGSIGRIAM
jgi:virginiamycin B lyase